MFAQAKFSDEDSRGVREFTENNCHQIVNVCIHIYSLLIQPDKTLLRYVKGPTCSYSRSSVTQGSVNQVH